MKTTFVWKQFVDPNFKGATGGFACQSLCNKQLRRPHITCMVCRLRRVYYGKLDSKVKIQPREIPISIFLDESGKRVATKKYRLLVLLNRRFQRVKDILLNKLWRFCGSYPRARQRLHLFSICELLAN